MDTQGENIVVNSVSAQFQESGETLSKLKSSSLTQDSTVSESKTGTLREALEHFVILRVAFLSVILGTSTWSIFYGGREPESRNAIFILIALTYAISIANLIAVKLIKRPQLIALPQFAVDVILTNLVIAETGSTTSITLYLIVILVSSLIMGRSGAIAIATISGLCYSLLFSGMFPLFSGNVPPITPHDILIVYLSLIAAAVIGSYASRRLEKLGVVNLKQARDLGVLTTCNRVIFDDSSQGIITTDGQLTITGINAAAKTLLGLDKLSTNTIIGSNLARLVSKTSNQEFNNLSGSHDRVGEIKVIRPDNGDTVYLHYEIKPISQNQDLGTVIFLFLTDISHVRDIEEKLTLHENMAKLISEEHVRISSSKESTYTSPRMIGTSTRMKNIFELVSKVSESDASVLITGESGTGKELIANEIHDRSDRRGKPFIAVNCGAIPGELIESELFGHKRGAFTGAVSDSTGLFRQAHTGTIFLDEIGELPLHLQTKLLRVLQERKVRPVGGSEDHRIDVRVISATNRNLQEEITHNRFREDLFYRLNVVAICLPPLRERKDDIPLLVSHIVNRLSQDKSAPPQISPEALNMLLTYEYPGNIRELENLIERSLVLGGNAVLPEHLPIEVRNSVMRSSLFLEASANREETTITILPLDLEAELARIEKTFLNHALDKSHGVKKHAAELLGLNFRSFRYRLKKYGLSDLDDDELTT